MSAALRKMKQLKEGDIESAPVTTGHKPVIMSCKGINHQVSMIHDDIVGMIPHAKKDSRIKQSDFVYIDEMASDLHCDTVILFENRHRTQSEPYLWVARTPEGPSMSFYIKDTTSINALRTVGNCMKGSRPLLCFDPKFEDGSILSLAKKLFTRAFSVPYQDPRSKPFVDRTMSFCIENNHIIIRQYQIQWLETPVLVEVGPRIKLLPTAIFAGVFKGKRIWKNEKFVGPFKINQMKRKDQQKKRIEARDKQAIKEEHKLSIPKQEDPMKGMFAPTD